MKSTSRYLFLAWFALSTLTMLSQYNKEDWEERDLWMKVPELMKLGKIGRGHKVADIGCHEGYFSFHLSKQVGSSGRIFAIDIAEYRLSELKEHIENRKVTNIEVILGDDDDPKLPKGQLDAVVVMDTYHEMEDYLKILVHVKEALKPNGRLLILEKLKNHKIGGTRDEQTDAHTLSADYVKEDLTKAGFSVIEYVEDFGYWKEETDKQMWVLVAVPKPE